MSDNLCARIGWGPNFTHQPSGDPTEQYRVEIAPVTRAPMSFGKECVINALLIEKQAKEAKKELLLFLSGGMDSQSMFHSFLEAEVDFTAVVYQIFFRRVLCNQPDVVRAQEACSKAGIRCLVTDVILDDYKLSTEYMQLTEFQHQKDLGLYLRRIVADRFKDWFIVQVGDLHTMGYLPQTNPDCFTAIFKPFNPSSNMFSEQMDGVSCFHQYTTESMLAYLDDKVFYSDPSLKSNYPSFKEMEDKANAGRPGMKGGVKFFETMFKPGLFARHFPNMVVYPKLTGFEDYPVDFHSDQDAIDITNIQLHRSVLIPIPILRQKLRTTGVSERSSDAPCSLLPKFFS